MAAADESVAAATAAESESVPAGGAPGEILTFDAGQDALVMANAEEAPGIPLDGTDAMDATATMDGELLPVDSELLADPDMEEVCAVAAPVTFESTMAALMEDMEKIKVEASEFEAKLFSTASNEEEETGEEEQAAPAPTADEDAIAASAGLCAAAVGVSTLPGSWHHAVTSDWRWLGCAPSEVWGDAELVLKAIAQDHRAMQYASQALRSHAEFVLKAVQLQGLSLQASWAGLLSGLTSWECVGPPAQPCLSPRMGKVMISDDPRLMSHPASNIFSSLLRRTRCLFHTNL